MNTLVHSQWIHQFDPHTGLKRGRRLVFVDNCPGMDSQKASNILAYTFLISAGARQSNIATRVY